MISTVSENLRSKVPRKQFASIQIYRCSAIIKLIEGQACASRSHARVIEMYSSKRKKSVLNVSTSHEKLSKTAVCTTLQLLHQNELNPTSNHITSLSACLSSIPVNQDRLHPATIISFIEYPKSPSPRIDSQTPIP